MSDLQFAKRVAIALGVAAIGYFFWLTSDVLLLVFAAILVAILLRTVADALQAYVHVGARWALPVATLLTLGLAGGFIYVFGSQLSAEVSQLVERLPDAVNAAASRLGIDDAMAQIENALSAQTGSSLLSRVTSWSYSLVSVLANLLLVLVAAVYLAADPALYRHGLAMLFPPDQQGRVLSALDATNSALRHWLAGQFATMLLIGVLASLAYWWIGLPSPIALGLIAGVTNFIPFLGPIIASVPPLVFALGMNVETVFWTIGAIVAIQQFEGNVATPLIQRRAVSLPPAMVVFAIVVFGVVFGVLGVFLAVPLAASLLVLIRKLWVRETLRPGGREPGDEDGGASA